MKKITFLVGLFLVSCLSAFAQVPKQAPDVMLQGFYWDSYTDKGYGRTKWTDLQTQVDEIAASFDLVWLPPSANSSGGTGYLPKEWCKQSGAWGDATQLKALIAAFKAKNTRCVADIVINHRVGNNRWTDFCDENFGTYGSFKLYDASTGDSRSLICKDDECIANGYVATGNNDSGYGYDPTCDGVSAKGAYCAGRDLDHSNTTVQNVIKAYLKWMKGEMGYDGWRYDLVKGYWGGYTKIYNNAAGAYMSVGEYWDGNYTAVKQWINDTEGTSMAFDFPNKYAALNDALKNGNYQAMGGGYAAPPGLCGSTETVKGKLMKAYAVTFVDNHDTFRDDSNFSTDGTMIVKANAYILSIPGIPCVFYPHWKNHKADIKKMMEKRMATISREITADTSKAKALIEGVIGRKINIFRAPGFSITKNDTWALKALADMGFEYDCSMFPASHDYGGMPSYGEGVPKLIDLGDGRFIKEFPINIHQIAGKNLVFSGGGFFRLFPYWLIKRWGKGWDYMMTYFHPRDFDNGQPIVPNLPLMRRFKSYVGIKGAFKKFQRLLDDFEFLNVEEADKIIDWEKAPVIKIEDLN